MPQDHLSPDEVSRRISVGVRQVYDLFNELNDLFRLMYQMLKESDSGIHPSRSKGFLLPKDAKASKAYRFVRTDMGMLAEIRLDDDDDEDDEEAFGDGDELDDDAEEEQVDRKSVVVTPESRFLGIRAILIDARDRALEPTVMAGVFGSLQLAHRERKNVVSTAQATFTLRRASLKKLVKGLCPETLAGRSVSHRVQQGQLSAMVTAFHRQPLASFGTKADVDEFVKRIVSMVQAS